MKAGTLLRECALCPWNCRPGRGGLGNLAQLINKVLFAPAAALSDKRELEFLDV